jgi:cyclopropane fatty-acyl-phospholipid synthase-like methyltransferase
MIHAFLNDLFQRVVTQNKREQRKKLQQQIRSLKIRSRGRVLDFGCGTGLFAPVFIKAGFNYYGYDIDERLLVYATKLYNGASFNSSLDKLLATGPFDLIMANCCFHHIDTKQLDIELQRIQQLLADDGVFLMIDLLLAVNDNNILRRLFRKLEKGAFIRRADDYQNIVKRHFSITDCQIGRSHVFSLKINPVYNDMIILVCKKPAGGKSS